MDHVVLLLGPNREFVLDEKHQPRLDLHVDRRDGRLRIFASHQKKDRRGMHGVVVLLLVFDYASCLASPQAPLVISTRKNGGGHHFRQFFSFGPPPPTLNNTTRTSPPSKRLLSASFSTNRGASWLRSTFLPVNYPSSVRTHYIPYSLWSALQDWSTSLRTVLATQRILEGVGVGQSTATAVSAVHNFLVRDAAGMAATLLFTSAAANRFTRDVKRWRLFADIMVDVGITLEVAAGQVPKEYFLPLLCLGNVCKAVCGVAAGATGGAITLYWGKDVADLSAKAGAQRTVVSALGLVMSAAFAQSIAKARSSWVWALYSVLTAFHIFANIKCLNALAFEHFNIVRLEMVAEDFLNSWTQGKVPTTSLSPRQVAETERLLFRPWDTKIAFGVSFNDFISRSYKKPSDVLREKLLDHNNNYVMSATDRGQVVVALRQNLTPLEQTKAYFHALLLRRAIRQVKNNRGKQFSQADLFLSEQIARQELENAWKNFSDTSQAAGWEIEQSQLQTRGFEVDVKYG